VSPPRALLLAATGALVLTAGASPAEIQQLRADALAFARANGEDAPDHGIVVSGRRREVVAATMGGAEVDTDQDVFVVRLHGNFVGYEASVPARVGPPHGHYLELVYDAETKQMTDWSISASPQDLTRLGHPVPLGP
jgi:alkanesulfonate monooxygenase SsuD/methylene tetrahydromethanopterin reductase-like flavin-dependent oxidoreductase (luciferase family)